MLVVFLSSYRNTVLNQSACLFALGYFLNSYNINALFFALLSEMKHGEMK